MAMNPPWPETDLAGIAHEDVEAEDADEENSGDDQRAQETAGWRYQPRQGQQHSDRCCAEQRGIAPLKPHNAEMDALLVAHVLTAHNAGGKQTARPKQQDQKQQNHGQPIAEQR